MSSVSTSYLRCRSELLLPHLSAVLVIEFVGVGELTGEKVLRCFGLICWDGGLRLGCTVVVGQMSYLSLKVIFEDVSSFAAGSSHGMGLIFSDDGPVSLLLLRAGGWMAPLVASGIGNVGSVFLFLLCGVDGRFTFIDLNSSCYLG
jgi:hypothetical protein